MPDYKLVMLDGLCGAGKSATAIYLALQYQREGIPYRYYWESQFPHPVNIRTRFQETVYPLQKRIFFSLSRWRAFVDYAQRQDLVTIFDSKPFGLTLFHLILHGNISQDQLVDYSNQLDEIVRPLKPKLVYLRQSDHQKMLDRLKGARGERWLPHMVRQLEDRSKDQETRFIGTDGFNQYIKHYTALLEAGLQTMRMDTLTVDSLQDDWSGCYREIHSFLDLPYGRNDEEKKGLHLKADNTPAELAVENRSMRALIAYNWPYKEHSAVYAFELSPAEAQTYETKMGQRFRIHDTNTGEVLEEIIVIQKRQSVVIGR